MKIGTSVTFVPISVFLHFFVFELEVCMGQVGKQTDVRAGLLGWSRNNSAAQNNSTTLFLYCSVHSVCLVLCVRFSNK